jgi:hypothetical protein
MAHEISIHRWDAEGRGRPAHADRDETGGRRVSEVLDTWLPPVSGRARRPARRGALWWPATRVTSGSCGCAAPGWRCSDTGTILDTDDHHARAQATGTASDLLLALMGRQRLDRPGGDR